MTDQPWTRREFQAALREAGWRRIAGPGSAYINNGKIISLDNVVMVDGVQVEEWEQWAVIRQTPPPF